MLLVNPVVPAVNEVLATHVQIVAKGDESAGQLVF